MPRGYDDEDQGSTARQRAYYHKQRIDTENAAKRRVPGAEAMRRKIDQKRFGSGRGDQAIDNSMETIGQLPSFATGGAEAKALGMAGKAAMRGVQAFRAGRKGAQTLETAGGQIVKNLKKPAQSATKSLRSGGKASGKAGTASRMSGTQKAGGRVGPQTAMKDAKGTMRYDSDKRAIASRVGSMERRESAAAKARGVDKNRFTATSQTGKSKPVTGAAAKSKNTKAAAARKAKSMAKDDKGGASSRFAKGAAGVGAAGGALYGAKKAKEKLDDLASRIPG
jgi:hypothetical protein